MSQQLLYTRPNAGVVQDKTPRRVYTAASSQPDTAADEIVYRSEHKHGSETRYTVHVSGRIPPDLRDQLDRIAAAHGWSRSHTLTQAVTEYIEHDLGRKFALRLAEVVTSAVDTGLQKHTNREAYLAAEGYYAAKEDQIITRKLLELSLPDHPDLARQFLQMARDEARTSLRGRGRGEEG